MPKCIEFSGHKKEQFHVKSNLKNVLQSVKYCGFCLENQREMFYHNLNDFSRFDKEISFCTLSKIVEEIFGEEMMINIPSKYICSLCKESLEQCYIFISKVKNTTSVLSNYVDEINEHIKDIVEMTNNTNEGGYANAVIVLHDHDNTETINTILHTHQEMSNELIYETKDNIVCYNTENIVTNTENCDIFNTVVVLQEDKNISTQNTSRKTIKLRPCKKETCTECKILPCIHEQYLDSLNLRKQIQNASDVPVFIKCIDCDYVCTSKSLLIAHVNKMHLNFNPYLCEMCGLSFHSKSSQYLHMRRSHTASNMCQYCDENIDNDFIEHVRKCKTTVRLHKCVLCDASFNDEDSLKIHRENHTNQYTCHVCQKSFENSSAYSMHRAKAHVGLTQQRNINTVNKIRKKPERQCSICCTKFSKLVELKEHLNSHYPGEKHNCQICAKEFDSRTQYLAHIKSIKHLRKLDPAAKLNIRCPDCDYSCQSNRYLEHHRNVVHLKKKPYNCIVCGKSFTTKVNLKGHLDLHVGVKRHKCELCDSRFSTTTGLKKHLFSQHLEGKPFACEMCDKTFLYRSEYDLHKLRSHGDRSISCPLCDGKFHAISNVRWHIVSVHAKGMNLDEFLKVEGNEDKAVELQEILRDRRLPVIEP